MIQSIKTIADVEQFAHDLVEEGLGAGFHPDTDFGDYGHSENPKERDSKWIAMYSKKAAKLRDKLLNQAHEVCDKNNVCIFDLMGDITQAELRHED